MSNNNNEFRAVHLQMIRCADRLDLTEYTKQSLSRYMLFDYFDVMLVREEDDENPLEYEDCIAQLKLKDHTKLEQHAKITAKNYCTLVRPSDQPYPDDLFSSGRYDRESYSNTPFIAIIMLTFIPKFIDTLTNMSPDRIIPFLRNCIDAIDQRAYQINGKDENQLACFATLNMGHFAIVVRSKDPLAPNRIARELNRTDAFKACENKQLQPMRFQTFTTQGMEMGLYWKKRNDDWIVKPKSNVIASENAAWAKDCLVVLRSSNIKLAKLLRDKAEAYQPEKQNAQSPSASDTNHEKNTMHWLFGRYHHTQRVPFRVYQDFYALLCYYKFGSNTIPEGFDTKYLPDFENATDVVNERLIIVCQKLLDTDKTHISSYHEPLPNPNKLLQILEEKLDNLLLHQDLLPFGQNVFYEHWRLFREVLATCASIFKFADSLYNGITLYMMLFIAIDAIEMYLCKLRNLSDLSQGAPNDPSQDNKRLICDTLLKSCSTFLEEIMSFLKTIQTLSFQTLQSPHYGIQPGIDGEKYTMAALEFARRYSILTTKINEKPTDPQNPSGKFSFPYLCIDHHFQEMQSCLRFPPLDTDYCGKKALPVLLKTSVPNFQYFARIYDILPLTIHEISHHIRFIKREERNKFFSELVFERVSLFITRNWFKRSGISCVPDYLSRFKQLVIKELTKALLTTYKEYNKKLEKEANANPPDTHQWQAFDMNDLMDNLNAFLFNSVFKDPDDNCNYTLVDPKGKSENRLKVYINLLYQYLTSFQESAFYNSICEHIALLEKQASNKSRDIRPVMSTIHSDIQFDIAFIINEEFKTAFDLSPNLSLYSSGKKSSAPKIVPCRQAFIAFLKSEIQSILEPLLEEDLEKKHELELQKQAVLVSQLHNNIDEIAFNPFIVNTTEHCKQYLNHIERLFYTIWDSILNIIPVNLRLINLVKQAKIEFSNSMKRIFDLRILLDGFRTINISDLPILTEQEQEQEKKQKATIDNPRNFFIEEAAANLSDKINQEIKNQSESLAAYLLFDSKQISKTQILASDPKTLETSLAESCKMIQTVEMDELLESSRHAYEEVCADLCMCAVLSLSPLGCLYLYAKHENRINDSLMSPPEKNSSFERFNNVFATLLLVETKKKPEVFDEEYYYAPASGLIRSIDAQIDKTASLIVSVLTKNFPDNCRERKAVERAFVYQRKTLHNILQDLLEGTNKTTLPNLSSEINKLIHSIIKPLSKSLNCSNATSKPDAALQLLYELNAIYSPPSGENKKDNNFINSIGRQAKISKHGFTVNNIFNQWRYLLICINYIITATVDSPYHLCDTDIAIKLPVNPAIRIKIEYYDYFEKMFSDIYSSDKRILSGNPVPENILQHSDLCKEIGRYYNDYDIVIKADKKRKMLDWTFHYLLTYYYCHMFSLPNLLNGNQLDMDNDKLYQIILNYLRGVNNAKDSIPK